MPLYIHVYHMRSAYPTALKRLNLWSKKVILMQSDPTNRPGRSFLQYDEVFL